MATVDVLIVGAGPTGLALAAELAAFGVRPRIVDRSDDRARESRALAIQPRTLEVLAPLGVTDQLVAAGNPAVQLTMHAPEREITLPLFDLGMADTAYSYLLFLSQSETERILGERLAESGVAVERGVELVSLQLGDDAASALLRHPGGREERVEARYVVGCDGGRSTVRRSAGIGFSGSTYPQTFVLADVDAGGLASDSAHAYLSERGPLFFFPLRTPAPWRLIAMRAPDDPTPPDAPLELAEVQELVDAYTGGTVRLSDPVWMTNFRLHHRAAVRYRSGPVFVAGDAAHVHSPAGAQGMNTGIQDAINLGWKLAGVLNGGMDPAILDTYHTERAPVGRTVLRFTDRAFRAATSTRAPYRFARSRIVPAVLPWVARLRGPRAYAFRMISELAIRYRNSPLSADGPGAPRRGPRSGDRLPDGPVIREGTATTLHAATSQPGWHLLLCGPESAWPAESQLPDGYGDTICLHRVSVASGAASGRRVLQDADGQTLRRLGLRPDAAAHLLIRPDGYIGYRAGGADLQGLVGYLNRWLPRPARTGSRPR